jgi:hypothetical protein
MCSNFFTSKSCHLRENVEECCIAREATNGYITRRMRFACWITKATNTRSEYVILVAFPRQQWLRERTSMLRPTHTPCLVNCCTWSLTSLWWLPVDISTQQGICAGKQQVGWIRQYSWHLPTSSIRHSILTIHLLIAPFLLPAQNLA